MSSSEDCTQVIVLVEQRKSKRTLERLDDARKVVLRGAVDEDVDVVWHDLVRYDTGSLTARNLQQLGDRCIAHGANKSLAPVFCTPYNMVL